MSDLRTSSTPTPPRRAKLELLVRPANNAEESFEVREIGSAIGKSTRASSKRLSGN